MGIDVHGTKFLLYAKSLGVDFSRTATIGRQQLFLKYSQFTKSVAKFNLDANADDATQKMMYEHPYADEFLKYLGAKVVDSFDYSDFEGATYTHDFNLPVAERHHKQYTALIEAGTLEHIFNAPLAIKNCMEMLAVGGYYIGMSPTNNFMGHGFYQFSPELYFRIFSKENGFKIEEMIVHETAAHTPWFTVTDPAMIKCRVTLTNSAPTSLLVLAQKIADCPIFATPPLQSDYVYQWESSHENTEEAVAQLSRKHSSLRKSIRDLTRPIRRFVRPYNPSFFEHFRM